MADQRINGNLILIGSQGGTIALGCQPSGGGFTILLPTSIPQVGQSLVISSVYNGNTATAQWATFSGVTSVAFTAPSIFSVSGSPVTTGSPVPTYNPGLTYITGQVITLSGIAYIALANVPLATPPPNVTYWGFTLVNPGIITLAFTTQAANTFLSGPVSGSAAVPTFRLLTITDLPATGTPSSTTFLRGDGTWAVPPLPPTYVVTFNGRSGVVVPTTGDYSYSQISSTPQLPVSYGSPSHQWIASYNSISGTFGSSQPAASDLSNGVTGSGAVVLATSPTISSPTISGTTVISGTVTLSGTTTFTTANPTFFASTGSGSVVLGISPTLSNAALAGNTSVTNIYILGTLSDGLNHVGTAGQVLTSTGTGVLWTAAAAGTVTSVALTVPNFLSVAGSPVTTSGTLAVTLATQAANTVFAGPTAGGAAVPAFRLLVIADLPATGTPSSTTFLRGDGVWAVPPLPPTYVTTFNGRSGAVVPTTGDYSYAQISGTPQLAQSYNSPAHQWLVSYNASTGLFLSSQPAAADLSDGTTGAGAIVLTSSPAITSPTLSGTTLINGTVTNSAVETYTVANPTFFASTGSGSVVLGTAPTISSATLTSNVHITGTLADGLNHVGTSSQVLSSTGTGVQWISLTTGTVTSFSAGNASPLFTTSVGTPTTTPALSFTLNPSVAQNAVYVGPVSGGPGLATFRALVAADEATFVQTVRFSAGTITSGTFGGPFTVSFSTPFANDNYTVEVTAVVGEALSDAPVTIGGVQYYDTPSPGSGVQVWVMNNDSISHTVTIHVIARHD